MKEKPVGEILTDTQYMGEYIAVREHVLGDGRRVGKIVVADGDPDVVHGKIRKDIKEYANTGAWFTYYFYKPFKPGEDREGWIINGSGERK